MSDDEIIAVVQAHKEGNQIQFEFKYNSYAWYDVVGNHPNWNFEQLNYRVAPEPRKPREFWLVSFDEFGDYHVFDNPKQSAHKQIHVREVND